MPAGPPAKSCSNVGRRWRLFGVPAIHPLKEGAAWALTIWIDDTGWRSGSYLVAESLTEPRLAATVPAPR